MSTIGNNGTSDTEDGLEIFFWKGQKFYRCPKKWESGASCKFASYEKRDVIEHMSSPHTADGKPPDGVVRRAVSPVLDSEGKQIIREYKEERIPTEFQNARFKQ